MIEEQELLGFDGVSTSMNLKPNREYPFWSGVFLKCAVHTDQDAVGVCQACGAGVCDQCSQRIGGIFYCLTCLDAGRYRPPKKTRTFGMEPHQVPTGYLTRITRQVFNLGIVAMALVIIGYYLLFFYPVVPGPSFFLSPYRTLAYTLIAIGITLTGITFFGFYRYYDSFVALSVSLFSLLSGWPMVLSDLLLYNPTVITPGSYPYQFSTGPLFSLYQFASIIGILLWVLTFIAWVVVFLRTRPFIPAPTLTVTACLLWIILSHICLFLMLILLIYAGIPFAYLSFTSTYIPLIMIIAAEPAAILTAIIFYRIRK